MSGYGRPSFHLKHPSILVPESYHVPGTRYVCNRGMIMEGIVACMHVSYVPAVIYEVYRYVPYFVGGEFCGALIFTWYTCIV